MTAPDMTALGRAAPDRREEFEDASTEPTEHYVCQACTMGADNGAHTIRAIEGNRLLVEPSPPTA